MSERPLFGFRRAEVADVPTVRRMMQESAGSRHAPQLSSEDLIRDAGLAGPGLCHIYLLELLAADSREASLVGYAVGFVCFSSWLGRIYFLEDVYVEPEYRKMGAGTRLFREVAARARELGCRRLDLKVRAGSPAARFCEKLGANNNTRLEERHLYGLGEREIEALIRQLRDSQ